MARLWRNNPATPEGKYLVKRRDGSVPEWPFFVISAADPAAPAALRGYAAQADLLGLDPEYTADILDLARKFEEWRETHRTGDPDAPRHRKDDPATVADMKKGFGA
jgi:hypothetical protein